MKQANERQVATLKSWWKRLAWLCFAILVVLFAWALGTQRAFEVKHKLSQFSVSPQTVDQINKQAGPILNQLVKTKYFRTFQVHIDRECPIWAQDKICKSGGCHLCFCNEKDIPVNWIKEKSRQVDELKGAGASWVQKKCQQGFWHSEEELNEGGEFLDLLSNKQAFTEYNGSHFWSLIYRQNCFPANDSCREQQALYRYISGLHTSITIQLAQHYRHKNDFFSPYKPNLTLFQQRLNGKDEYGGNMYFTFVGLIRAMQVYMPTIASHAIDTGHSSDQLARALIANLSKVRYLGFGPTVFDEVAFFGNQTATLKQDYRKYIYNISRLLDCVGCSKCKVYGKLQIYGISYMLRALLGQRTQLKRNALIAFVNTVQKLSSSISAVQQMRLRLMDKRLFQVKIISLCTVLCLLFMRLALFIFEQMPGKIRKMFKRLGGRNLKID